MRILLGIFGVAALVGVVACGEMETESERRGKDLYTSFCVSCHGVRGVADGPLAQSLPVAPADLSQLSASNDGVFPTERVMVQVFGYPGKFHQGLMPEFGPLLEGEQVEWVSPSGEKTLTPRALLDIVAYVKTLQET
ncbi:Cytochrome c [Pelagimonas phthalicica]|uniref:Cytochrome c n=1 Tax=Pelagimonas phthalicica TaxID=1037362 RepID=A0A238J9E4_9RHOB|nr:cytochrome c [Pelagimonas phthalicica]TDS94145.1 mono/diheme cytochrome c family protein [Pelagimonas phthalicica]SMX27330.1 Cytochrome c [Pelagimonas phthalicica]